VNKKRNFFRKKETREEYKWWEKKKKKDKLVLLNSEKLKAINALLIISKIISMHKQAVACAGCFIQK